MRLGKKCAHGVALVYLCCSIGCLGSESPERDCCEPLYPFLHPKLTTSDWLDNDNKRTASTTPVPDIDLVIPNTEKLPLACTEARQHCFTNRACAKVLQLLPQLCGLEIATCSSTSIYKCDAAIRTLLGFSYYSPKCFCHENKIDNIECHQFYNLIYNHPCVHLVKTDVEDIITVDALTKCTDAYGICKKELTCKTQFHNFEQNCRTLALKCDIVNRKSCQIIWSKLRETPLFGCTCSTEDDIDCDKIYEIFHANPCLDTVQNTENKLTHKKFRKFWKYWYNYTIELNEAISTTHGTMATIAYSLWTDNQQSVEESISTPVYLKTSQGQSSEVYKLQSTCHIAMNSCERSASCNLFLEQVKRTCDIKSCDQQKCRQAIEDMYKNIPSEHSQDIAFCLCKHSTSQDERCQRAQSVLQPVCAQSPTLLLDVEVVNNPPACHKVAKACQGDPKCRTKLKQYEQACAVDSISKSCLGPPDACRRAMINILGTELRTSCACDGVAADFRELYDCYGWLRLLWENLCVVEAQKEFISGKPQMTTTSMTQIINSKTTSGFGTEITSDETETHTTHTRLPKTDYPSTPSTTFVISTGTTSTHILYLPTIPPKYPTPPWPKKLYSTKATTVISTTITTTTTTLPPKFCLLERPGQPVKYIREGYKKRLYKFDDPECSELCECNIGEVMACKVLDCIARDACNTGVAFYSHASPFYQAYRGQCLCYSGSFICSKPPKDVELALASGIYLFIGYSTKDEQLLKAVTGDGVMATIGAIQGLVSYHNINSNKSDCRIVLQVHEGENLVLQAIMDEFEGNRAAGNLTTEVVKREKDECFESLESISRKINTNDADMRSHVVLSMIKVSAVLADVPELKSGATYNCFTHWEIVFVKIVFYYTIVS